MLLTIVLCLLVIAIPATPVVAKGPSVSVHPASGPVGTTVTVSGNKFHDGDIYSITFAYGTTFAQTVVSDTTIVGTTFTATFSVPTVPRDSYTILIETLIETTPKDFSKTFTVTPQITLGATSGHVGDTVTVSGTGFDAGSTVTIYFDTNNVGTVTADANGTFTNATFTVPESYRGSHTVKGSDASGDSPDVTFTISPEITVTPTSGAVGDTVTVSGTGFNASLPVTIYFDTTAVGTTTADANGTFTGATFTVPESYEGSHTVKGSDDIGDSPDVTFTILPTVSREITVTPTSGAVGDTVTVSGTGFNPGSTVTIYFNTNNVGTVTADANGSFTNATFTVPESYRGSHTVKGSDASGDSPDVTFTISPEITVTPTSGQVGDTVTVSGTGFDAGSTVTIYFDTTSVATVTADANGSFTNATFTVPESYRGSHTIKGSDASGDSPDVGFTISPKITVTPTSGQVGDTVTVSGTGFSADSSVTIYFDTNNVATVTADANGSFTGATFTVPESYEGSHTIKGSDASGDSPDVTFTISPEITVTPTSGQVGDTVTVNGTGFSADSSVTIYFDTTSVATATTDANGSFTNATFTVPESYRGSHTVKGSDASGDSPDVTFTISPKITVTPTSGAVGDTVTVNGTGFDASSTVTIYFDTTSVATATTDANGSFTSATFTVPETYEGSHTIKGSDASGDSPDVTFTISSTISPEITVTPTSGAVGDTVTVSGTGFNPSSTVTIYFDTTSVATATTNANGSFTSATFTVPESYEGSHTIKGSDASGDSPDVTFTILSKITVTPTSGAAGDTVTISGTGFDASSTVTIYFDTTSVATATTNANGSFTSATFTVPESYEGSHTIKAQDASANYATATFTIGQEITITPTSGASGTTVTISGTGFSASKSVTIKYNAVPVTTNPVVISTDATGIFTGSFNVPAGLVGTYSVEATDGTYSASANFVAAADATISQTTTEASPGYVGTELTITGTGFIPNATVTITYTTEPFVLATVTTDANGAFSVAVTIPPSTGGEHFITVTDGDITKQFTFVMESQAPPIPAPLLPEEGTKAKAEAYFDWEDADDPSGITYTLQIASDEDFTTIVLEKADLTSSEYTITKEEKLESVGKKEPYYWRVKAIDGASNESQWSTPRSFYIGFQWPELKGWPLYTLIGLGVLLPIILGFWLGRRTAYLRS